MDVRVYYEDTDAGGVVYYANYLKYCERARMEFFRDRGIGVSAYGAEGILFVVAHAEVSYKASARHDDLLTIKTYIIDHSRTSYTFLHRIFRKETEELLVEAKIRLACVDRNVKVRRLPEPVKRVVEEAMKAAREELSLI